MRTITAREANQQFSKLLEAAASGEEVTITRRGVPVAKLVPASPTEAEVERTRRREAALAWLEREPLTGGVVADWTRDELYERD
ncbi:type II toxin-antitoxin system Phd/YefM family antitoxin [Benzoatithermus flavus]|uniref:Antitoxin n=1 Tax=Benzoatithermus flavus TaxID=3108223 RepID=A0ABU8XRM8_9PROT